MDTDKHKKYCTHVEDWRNGKHSEAKSPSAIEDNLAING